MVEENVSKNPDDKTCDIRTTEPAPIEFSQLEESLIESKYFQQCLNNILVVTQPSFYCLDFTVKILLHGPDGSGKRLLARHVAKSLQMKFCEDLVSDLFDENIVGTEKKVKASLTKACNWAPCVIYLTGYQLFTQLDDPDIDRIEHCIREQIDQLRTSQPVIFIAATNDHNQVYKSPLSHMFQHDIAMKSPTLQEAHEILDIIARNTEVSIEPKKLLDTCSNGEYFLGNLIDSISQTEFSSESDKEQQSSGRGGGGEESEDTEAAGTTHWEDIGGLSEVKREIIDTIQLTIDYPQLRDAGLRRTGVLLYGPPGTGKTLLAKAVATECNLSFINVKGPELLNEYVGQSEDNVRQLFKRARELSPSIIFFDEIDSLAPNRGQAGDSGGVMDRTVSQILAEMDGVGKGDDVFVIGATNRVDLVDSSLLRPGRFDKVLEVPLPKGKENRLQILRALTRKMSLSSDVDLDVIESKAPADMSGAEFRGLCSRALHKAFDRCIDLVESGQANEDNVDVSIMMSDFISSIEAD